jgi:hypothetical protein
MLASVGIAGQAFLLAVAWLLPFLSGYHLVSDNISELALGRFGLLLTIAFLASGIGTLALSGVIRSSTTGERGSLTGSLLLAVYGAGAILAAIFPTNRVDSASDVWAQSTTGLIHIVVALVSFLSAVIGMFVLTRTFARVARWQSITRWSALLAASALALFFVQQEGPWVGLMQRLLVTAIAAWLIMVGLKARSTARE